MNSKHTPGPWHVGMRPGPIVYGPKGEMLADVRCGSMLQNEEAWANWRIICAAPELLEALEALLGQEDWTRGEDVDPRSPVGLARAAIRKAKGEA